MPVNNKEEPMKQLKSFAALILAMVMILAFSAPAFAESGDLDYIMKKGTLVVGFDDAFPPFSYQADDGTYDGFDLACAKELADLAIVLYDRLGFADGTGRAPDAPADASIPVSGTGGVFNIGPAVTEPFVQILRRHGMHYVKAATTPDMGALMLAVRYGQGQSQ